MKNLLLTYHGTYLCLSEDGTKILHERQPERPLSYAVYGRKVSLYDGKSGRYLQSMDEDGTVMLSEDEVCMACIWKGNSVAFPRNGKYLCARKEGGCKFAPRALTWEYFRLQNVYQRESGGQGKEKAVLAFLDGSCMEAALDCLNAKDFQPVAIFTPSEENFSITIGRKSVPVYRYNDGALKELLQHEDCAWLICGSGDCAGRMDAMAEYLQGNGIPGSRILHFAADLDGPWMKKMQQAEGKELDYFITGGRDALAGIGPEGLSGLRGVNLACDGQTMEESFLVARYLLQKGTSCKFAIIGLSLAAFLGDAPASCGSIHDWKYSLLFARMEETAGTPWNLLDEAAVEALQPQVPSGGRDAFLDDMLHFRQREGAYGRRDVSGEHLEAFGRYLGFCMEHGIHPVIVVFPVSWDLRRGFWGTLLSSVVRMLESVGEIQGFHVFDLSGLPLEKEDFLSMDTLGKDGAALVGNFLNFRLRREGILPRESLCSLNYQQIADLFRLLGKDEYNAALEQVFRESVRGLRGKKKLRIGFVLYDSSMWCGDGLYHLFAEDARYEPTVFLCLRKDERSVLLEREFERGLELFRSRGLNVVGVDSHNADVPLQDVYIYLTPYFLHLPRPFRRAAIPASSLMVYIPYTVRVDPHGLKWDINRVAWKFFFQRPEDIDEFANECASGMTRGYCSGHPKLDIFFQKGNRMEFRWKMSQPDAVKIIYAPHWSIQGFKNVRYSTFQHNYKFMYEYAREHPETSWVVKPHPQLIYSAVSTGLFSSVEDFDAYLKAWDDLPNAMVSTGGGYQEIFATSDGMINDSCSFLAEYQYTHKPMLYLTRDTQVHNDLGKELVEAMYHVDGRDFEGIAHFIRHVLVEGQDDRREERRRVFDRHLNYPEKNGMLASEYIYRKISEELKNPKEIT